MFILCASALHAFDIGPPVDEKGHPVRIEYTMTADTVVSYVFFGHVNDDDTYTVYRHAGTHEYTIKPRSLQAERLVLDSDIS